jgi:hypothetical protein
MTFQQVMKDDSDLSWFTYIQHLLRKYQLPCTGNVVVVCLTKLSWKMRCTAAIGQYFVWRRRAHSDTCQRRI